MNVELGEALKDKEPEGDAEVPKEGVCDKVTAEIDVDSVADAEPEIDSEEVWENEPLCDPDILPVPDPDVDDDAEIVGVGANEAPLTTSV